MFLPSAGGVPPKPAHIWPIIQFPTTFTHSPASFYCPTFPSSSHYSASFCCRISHRPASLSRPISSHSITSSHSPTPFYSHSPSSSFYCPTFSHSPSHFHCPISSHSCTSSHSPASFFCCPASSHSPAQSHSPSSACCPSPGCYISLSICDSAPKLHFAEFLWHISGALPRQSP